MINAHREQSNVLRVNFLKPATLIYTLLFFFLFFSRKHWMKNSMERDTMVTYIVLLLATLKYNIYNTKYRACIARDDIANKRALHVYIVENSR